MPNDPNEDNIVALHDRQRRRNGTPAPETDWPRPLATTAMPGILGDIIAALEPHTESDTAALVFQFHAAFGNVIGADAHYLVEGDVHSAKLNVLLVGPTAKARKGTSLGRIRALFGMIDPVWMIKRVKGGLSTGEGLLAQVRDARLGKDDDGSDVVLVAGVDDKRFLAVSTEFGGVLRAMERSGNTLSQVTRDAWDRSNLSTLTKGDPITATGAHISQIGHITKDELLRYLQSTETANGFANRYLFVCVRRSKLLPNGGGDIDWTQHVTQLKEIIETARQAGRLRMDAQAEESWRAIYAELADEHAGLLGAITARGEAQIVRLALIYALLDQAIEIKLPHLDAAYECWRYCEDSARCIFGDALGDPIADTILGALRRASDGMTQTDISNFFARNIEASKLAQGLQVLLRHGLAACEQQRAMGRPATVWRAT